MKNQQLYGILYGIKTYRLTFSNGFVTLYHSAYRPWKLFANHQGHNLKLLGSIVVIERL